MLEETNLSQSERLIAIREHLSQSYQISIEDICRLFGVTRDTARRDLIKLDSDGLILRVRGGGVLPPAAHHIERFGKRDQDSLEKRRIGEAAARLIRAEDRVLLDTSSTVLEAARAIRVSQLNVLTNSIDIADAVSQFEGIQLHVLGGQFNPWQRSLEGPRTLEELSGFQVDKAVIGVCGIDQNGVTCLTETEAVLKRAMMDRATQVIMLVASGKYGRSFFHKLCGLEKIDVLVTDRLPPQAIASKLALLGVDLIVCQPEEEPLAQ